MPSDTEDIILSVEEFDVEALEKLTKAELVALLGDAKVAAQKYQARYLKEIEDLEGDLSRATEYADEQRKISRDLQRIVSAEQEYGDEVHATLDDAMDLAMHGVHYEPNSFNERVVADKLTGMGLRLQDASRARDNATEGWRRVGMTPTPHSQDSEERA